MTYRGIHLGGHCQSQDNVESDSDSNSRVRTPTSWTEDVQFMPPGPPSTFIPKLPLEPSEEHGMQMPHVIGHSSYADEDLPFLPPGPPSTLIPKLAPEYSEEHELWLAKSELLGKAEVLNEESWRQPYPNVHSLRQQAPEALQQAPEALQQDSLQQQYLNLYSAGKEGSAGTVCSSIHALLQQVELQHVREIGLVRAELASQQKVRAELESHLADLRQTVEDPECKQLLQQLLHQRLQSADRDATPRSDQPEDAASLISLPESDASMAKTPTSGRKSAKMTNSVDVVQIASVREHNQNQNKPTRWSFNGTSAQSSNPNRVIPQRLDSTLSAPENSGFSFSLHDIKARMSKRKTVRQTTMGLRLSDLMEGRLSEEEEEIAWASRRFVRALVDSAGFEAFCAVAILSSAMLLGISTDLAARTCNPDSPPDFFIHADYAFTTLFLLELCLRICSDGILLFFVGKNWNWNIFDFMVVAVDVVTTICVILQTSQTSFLSVTRVARILKLTRSLRAIRLFRFLRELRKMVLSIMRSGLTLFYSMLLLCIIIFMFSVFLTQNITFYLYDNKGESSDHIESLQEYFGSLIYAGYILFQCITTGIAWGDVGMALLEVHWSNGLVLCFFIFFTIFAVLNMITGVFVDSALTSAQNERDEKINHVMEKEGELVSQLQEFFEEADVDNSGYISMEKLIEQLKKPMARARLRTLDIDLSDSGRVFALLDTDKTGEVGIEDFIFGCLRMKGTARSIDLITMMREMKGMKVLMKTSFRDVHDKFKQQQQIQTDLLQLMSYQQAIAQLARNNVSWSSSKGSKPRPPSPNAPVSKAIQNGIERLEAFEGKNGAISM